jgi:hypothetical protein
MIGGRVLIRQMYSEVASNLLQLLNGGTIHSHGGHPITELFRMATMPLAIFQVKHLLALENNHE